MAEKDITEKQLFELEDVFADIVNTLLLNGKSLILPEELKPAKKDSIYKDEELKTKMQERDVAKLWTQGNVRLAFFGLEDQTSVDYVMPLRIVSYDAAVYRAMLLEVDKHGGKKKFPLYPAITMVLHFDYERHWTGHRSLKECFEKIPPGLDPYVSDYKINVFEIAWLPDDTIAKFKSDFRFVADYYAQMRKTGKWQPMPGNVKHIKELFDLFNAVTKDNRFIQMYKNSKGVVNDMSCVALDYLREDLAKELKPQWEKELKPQWEKEFKPQWEKEFKPQWEKEFKPQWESQGEDRATLNSIRSLMQKVKWTAEQAMDALSIPQENRKRYLDKI